MSEKLTAKQAAEQLLYKPEYAADKSIGVKKEAAAFAEGYKKFMDSAKTEREATAYSEKLLTAAGTCTFVVSLLYIVMMFAVPVINSKAE